MAYTKHNRVRLATILLLSLLTWARAQSATNKTNTTSSSKTPPDATTDLAPPLATTTSATTPPPKTAGLINYYFVFLGLLVGLLLGLTWLYYRRRKRTATTQASRRAAALSRDLSQAVQLEDRRRTNEPEGLNEDGEAPPPYVAREVWAPVPALTRGDEDKVPDYE